MRTDIRTYETVDSTNTVAGSLADQGAPEGTVVVAEVQTAGRGRKGDHWFSDRGGLWFTIILRPDTNPQRTLLLPLLMGFSVHRAIGLMGVGSRIKLPNDVMIGDKKLCGILCENRLQGERVRHVLVGVGINVVNDPPDIGISLKDLTDGPLDRFDILADVLDEFKDQYQEFLHKEYFYGGKYDSTAFDRTIP